MNSSFIGSLLLGGYRSFGRQTQRLDRFTKINLLIGPNNSGKSNVLRFIHEVYPKLRNRDALPLAALDRHFPESAEFRVGCAISLELDNNKREYAHFNEFVNSLLPKQHQGLAGVILQACKKKAELDNTDDVWFQFNEGRELLMDNWGPAFDVINDQALYSLWSALTGQSRGSRKEHWFPESLRKIAPPWSSSSVELIPAIRRVGAKGSESQEFGGDGLIERLARLQNPEVLKQSDKQSFTRINQFLKTVTDNASAEIEVPYARDTINVHMDGKTLPLESLGTGIHEVVILAAAATIVQNQIVCMEEPELHLNPILQRKLVRYLSSDTNNQYFITTHSAALMDTPGAEIYHVQIDRGDSVIQRVTSDRRRSIVCEDLGYHPSDLLQANCVIWVEGPSDRIYINHWIRNRAPELVEGIHFSIMFYGGRLASHLSGNDIDELIQDFISLRRLNRRAVIVIDSDRKAVGADLNATKKRLIEEFDAGPGYAWVTDGREIENYLPPHQIQEAIKSVMPKATSRRRWSRFDRFLEVTIGDNSKQAAKVEIAKFISATFEPDETRLDLAISLQRLIQFIRTSNPRNAHVAA